MMTDAVSRTTLHAIRLPAWLMGSSKLDMTPSGGGPAGCVELSMMRLTEDGKKRKTREL